MRSGGSENEAEPNLTPLLDVVLQLIMFFMITVNFVRVEHLNDEVKLPVATAAVPKDKDKEGKKAEEADFVYLNINKDGKIVGREEDWNSPGKLEFRLGEMMKQFRREAALKNLKEPNVILVLRADQEARYEALWSIMKTSSAAGFKRYQLRAMAKPSLGGEETR